jgi:hypothetical protein
VGAMADGSWLAASRDFLGCYFHWIALRENLQETTIFHGKNYGFL